MVRAAELGVDCATAGVAAGVASGAGAADAATDGAGAGAGVKIGFAATVCVAARREACHFAA